MSRGGSRGGSLGPHQERGELSGGNSTRLDIIKMRVGVCKSSICGEYGVRYDGVRRPGSKLMLMIGLGNPTQWVVIVKI